MKFRWQTILWTLLWAAALAGITVAARRADRAFQAFLGENHPTLKTACDLLPADVDAFASDSMFRDDWKTLRPSGLYAAARQISFVKPLLQPWGLAEETMTPTEKWLLRSWGSQMIVAYRRADDTLYLLSPLGDRTACLRWLVEMMLDGGFRKQWSFEQHEGHWRFVVLGDETSLTGRYLEFHVIRGVAALAIGAKPHPLSTLYRTVAEPSKSLGNSPDFESLVAAGLRDAKAPFGFLRIAREGQSPPANLQWKIQRPANQGQPWTLSLTLPVRCSEGASHPVSEAAQLARLNRSDDILAAIAAWEDVKSAWGTCLHHLPAPLAAPLSRSGLDWVPEAFRDIWKPVLARLGDQAFIGLGESSLISEHFHISLPRTVVAIPFSDPAGLVRAIEATVLKCNRDSDANLLIRKTIRATGEYYTIRMDNSPWMRRYGLDTLPVFGFANNLLILTSSTGDMEKAFEQLSDAQPPVEGAKTVEGLRLRMNPQRIPDTIRALLASGGTLLGLEQNVFLRPMEMKNLTETLALLGQFSEAQVDVTHATGLYHLDIRLEPRSAP